MQCQNCQKDLLTKDDWLHRPGENNNKRAHKETNLSHQPVLPAFYTAET